MKILTNFDLCIFSAAVSWPMVYFGGYKTLISLIPHNPTSALSVLILLVGIFGVMCSFGIALYLFKSNRAHAALGISLNVACLFLGFAVLVV